MPKMFHSNIRKLFQHKKLEEATQQTSVKYDLSVNFSLCQVCASYHAVQAV